MLKDSAVTDIVSGIRAVAAGEHFTSPALTSYLIRRQTRTAPRVTSGLDVLTPAELRVLELVADYKTSREIGEALHVSYRTVLHRLARADRGIWAKFQDAFARARGRTLLREDEPEALASESFRASPSEPSRAAEPERLSPVDFTEDRLADLVRRALEQEAISLGRAAEILSLSLVEMRALAATWVA